MNKSLKITVYSTPDCAFCYTVKDYLQEKGFEYKEVNIYDDDAGREKMEKLSGQQNVPVTIINDEIVLKGWNKQKFNEALGI